MAIYHCAVKVIGRNAGRSSVAAAAYRSGESLVNEYDGIEHDFTKKNWVEFTEILLPENAPMEYSDRSTLWNAVEMSEKSKDAQLCREFELSLPKELSREQQIEVVEQFVKDKLVSQGMIADIAIHNPPVMNDRHQPIDKGGNPTKDISSMQFINPHSHILVTMRPLDENGKWAAKSKTEYLCKRNGEEKGFTAEEYKTAKDDGWEKQYKYSEGKKKIWLTAKEAEERGLERVNRSPKTTPFGRKNEIIEYWNSKDRIFEWRQHWEKVVNDKFASINSEIRIDSRSFKDQGLEEELPTIHMGTAATNMEKRAEREIREGKSEYEVIHSDIGNINKQIKEHNRFVREIKAKLKHMFDTAKDHLENLARYLGSIRSKIIGNKYEESVLSRKLDILSSQLSQGNELLEKYHVEFIKIEEANKADENRIKNLKNEMDRCTLMQFMKKKRLQEQMQELRKKIDTRNDYIHSISRMCGFGSDREYLDAKKDYLERYEAYKDLESTLNHLQKDTLLLSQRYQSEFIKGEPGAAKKLIGDVEIGEKETDMNVLSYLKEKYGYEFDPVLFSDAKLITDRSLGIKKNHECKDTLSHQMAKNHNTGIEKRPSARKAHH